jgi:hypothetical protein
MDLRRERSLGTSSPRRGRSRPTLRTLQGLAPGKFLPVGVSGIEAKEGAEETIFPLELFSIPLFQKALVSQPHHAGEPAHQV